MKEELERLGLGIAFTNQANFQGINPGTGLQISRVVHKTFIDVNEQGTEAAAVTATGMETTSAGPRFLANRPFLFAITEVNTGSICFIGEVAAPKYDD